MSFALIILSICVSAQDYFPFPENNAIWNIKYSNTWEGNDEIRYGISGDTIIEDVSYHKVYLLKDSTLIHPESTYYCGLREESKRIYVKFDHLDNDLLFDLDEQLLYDFNLNVGDSIKYNFGGFIYKYNGQICFSHVSDTFYRKVILIDTVSLFNGSQRRHYVLEKTDGFQCFNEEWIEGIGSCVWNGLFNPFVVDLPTNGDGWSPICFKVDDEVVYLDNPDCGKCFCKEYTGVIDVDSKFHSELPYPNPANNILVFKFPPYSTNKQNENTIKIRDINGRLLQEIHANSDLYEVNISDFPNGVYIFETINNGRLTQTGTFIKD